MKVTIQENKIVKKIVREYPYYGKTDDEMIVLFSDKDTGTVISKGKGKGKCYSIGYCSKVWLENDFVPMDVEEIIFKVVS